MHALDLSGPAISRSCRDYKNGQMLAKKKTVKFRKFRKGWLAIAKLKPLSLFISILLMLKKALDNVKIEK